ncbi:unnamed protein product, partial [Scytosiphon promiscuus]
RGWRGHAHQRIHPGHQHGAPAAAAAEGLGATSRARARADAAAAADADAPGTAAAVSRQQQRSGRKVAQMRALGNGSRGSVSGRRGPDAKLLLRSNAVRTGRWRRRGRRLLRPQGQAGSIKPRG